MHKQPNYYYAHNIKCPHRLSAQLDCLIVFSLYLNTWTGSTLVLCVVWSSTLFYLTIQCYILCMWGGVRWSGVRNNLPVYCSHRQRPEPLCHSQSQLYKQTNIQSHTHTHSLMVLICLNLCEELIISSRRMVSISLAHLMTSWRFLSPHCPHASTIQGWKIAVEYDFLDFNIPSHHIHACTGRNPPGER